MGSVLGSDDHWCNPLPEINCSVLLTGRQVVSDRSDTCSHLPHHSRNSIHPLSLFGLAAADADKTYILYWLISMLDLIFRKRKKKKSIDVYWLARESESNKQKVKCSFSIIQMRFRHNPATTASIKQYSSLFLGSSSRMIVCRRHQTSGVRENISLWDFRPSGLNNATILLHIVV